MEVEKGKKIMIDFGIDVVVIYIVIEEKFERLRDKLIIMMQVKIQILGDIVKINIGIGKLKIYKKVGIIKIVGMIKKKGIMMVEFENKKRRMKGIQRREEIVVEEEKSMSKIMMKKEEMEIGVVKMIIEKGEGDEES